MSYELHLEKNFCIITFPSTQHALKAEKILQSHTVDFIIIPTPREITASCGLSIKCFPNDKDNIVNLLENTQVVFENAYLIDRTKGNKLIEKLDKNTVN